MRNQQFSYFAFLDEQKSPGVMKKIDNTVEAARRNGFLAERLVFKNNIQGIRKFITALFFVKSDVVMIRFSDLVFPVLFLFVSCLRARGVKVVIDVPTPRHIGLKEMDVAIANPFKRIVRKTISYLSASWVLMPANLIVQYADESKWFSLGVKNKTIKIGNGVLIDELTPITKAIWPNDTLNLIAVAQLADWHGYDRLLHALSELKSKSLAYKVNLTVVGDGDALDGLKKLSANLGLDNVNFTGRLTGKELDDAFEYAHVGVASLGLYRIGLTEASVLKTREYMARGLCVIGVGKDPDFDSENKFRFLVPNSGEIDAVVDLLSSFNESSLAKPKDVRVWAEERLSLDSKFKFMMDIAYGS